MRITKAQLLQQSSMLIKLKTSIKRKDSGAVDVADKCLVNELADCQIGIWVCRRHCQVPS